MDFNYTFYYPTAEVIKSGTRSILLRDGNIFLKVFTSRDCQSRAERERGFYSQFKSPYIPSYIRLEYKQKFPVILFKLIRKSDPGFLSDEAACSLNNDQFELLRIALEEVRVLGGGSKVLIHNDLAPHNIWLDKKMNSLVIADWDGYRLSENVNEAMYDYATFWAWLHHNEEYLIRQFLEKEVSYLVSKGLWVSFSYCYLKRCEILKCYPESFNRGIKLRDTIMALIV